MSKVVSIMFGIHVIVVAGLPAHARGPEARSPLDVVAEAMTGGTGYSEPAVSPDGRSLAWGEGEPGRGPGGGRGRGRGDIYVASLETPAQKKRIASGTDFSWSPDGRQLVYRSGPAELDVVPAAGGTPKKVVALKGLLSHARWSPDCKKIAFLYIENAKFGGGPTAPKPAATGVIDEDQFIEQRLGVVDLADGKFKLLSPPDLYVYEFDWSPDAARFVICAARGSGDNNWYIAQLYSLSATTGAITTIVDPKMQLGFPRWSPDGKSVAFVGGLMSDQGAIGGDVYTVPAAGGTLRNLTQTMKASATWLTWLAPNRILFTETIDGGTGIAEVDTEKGQVKSLWTGNESIAAGFAQRLALSRDGSVSAVIRQSFNQPPEMWVGPIGKWKPITSGNQKLKPMWGDAKSLHWKSDEWTIQGWLLYPYKFDSSKRYPMIVVPHGGPTGAVGPRWPGPSQDAVLSYDGYFIFLPNPRGSTGQGEKFVRANIRDFGYGDLRDILRGVDEVLKVAPVDGERLGIMGGSYGGYMTMWAVTQTHRFKAAVALAGVSNWQSYYGENGIDQWLIPFFGASVYDDPAVYAKSSPMTFIKNVKTPTLVMVGEHDIECPVPQSYEFYRALKRLGVPTQLVVYAGAGHGFYHPKQRRDSNERSLAWLRKYLKEPSQKNDDRSQPQRAASTAKR